MGEPNDGMLRIMAHTPHSLPVHKPRCLMGVDMFDRVMPTRNAHNGHLLVTIHNLHDHLYLMREDRARGV